MKAIKFIGALIAAFALCVSFTACNNDDDDEYANYGEAEYRDLWVMVEEGIIKPTVEIKESSSELVLTAKFGKYLTYQQTAKFSNKVCKSAISKYTYCSEKMAQAAWDLDYGYEERQYSKLNGKTITEDWTDKLAGESYEYILNELKSEKRGLESGTYFE